MCAHVRTSQSVRVQVSSNGLLQSARACVCGVVGKAECSFCRRMRSQSPCLYVRWWECVKLTWKLSCRRERCAEVHIAKGSDISKSSTTILFGGYTCYKGARGHSLLSVTLRVLSTVFVGGSGTISTLYELRHMLVLHESVMHECHYWGFPVSLSQDVILSPRRLRASYGAVDKALETWRVVVRLSYIFRRRGHISLQRLLFGKPFPWKYFMSVRIVLFSW